MKKLKRGRRKEGKERKKEKKIKRKRKEKKKRKEERKENGTDKAKYQDLDPILIAIATWISIGNAT